MRRVALQQRNPPDRSVLAVAPDVGCIQLSIVNAYLVGEPRPGGEWVLVDTGLATSAHRIAQAAEEHFGADSRPSAIVLTHGHFDHVGSVRKLAERWEVPVYAHALELPYLTGRSDYPPPDPTVGGGAIAASSRLFPYGGIDLRPWIRRLPEDGSVPGMPGWRWIHTPGHSPGHVALFRNRDRVLIAGDAFVTTHQESLFWVMTRRAEISRPPAYFTPDWEAARASVEALARLRPSAAATGHGIPLFGDRMLQQLDRLARSFDRAVPEHGRYVGHPALADERGVVALPPPVSDGRLLLALAATAVVGAVLLNRRAHRSLHA